MNRVAWLHTLDDRDRDRAGGKAYVLARLRRAGLPVPDGFVLTAGTSADDPSWREEFLAAYRELGGSVAVRSSSTLEGGERASFAAPLETRLDIEGEDGVVAAVRACLGSAPAGPAHLRALGTPARVPRAVLVQRFVPARVSGVVLTRDPGMAERLLVEVHPGRDDAEAGPDTPERYQLDRATLRVTERSSGAGVVDAPTLQAVATLALAVERLLGGAQEVEWALSEAGPMLLQSRPIRVTAERPPGPGERP